MKELNARRRRIADLYNSQFSTLDSQLIVPFVPNWAEPVWYVFVVRHSRRRLVQQKLAEAGIGTLIHYPVPPHLSGAYHDLEYSRGVFPVAEELSNTVLSLPMGPHVSTEQVTCVVEAFERATCSL